MIRNAIPIDWKASQKISKMVDLFVSEALSLLPLMWKPLRQSGEIRNPVSKLLFTIFSAFGYES